MLKNLGNQGFGRTGRGKVLEKDLEKGLEKVLEKGLEKGSEKDLEKDLDKEWCEALFLHDS